MIPLNKDHRSVFNLNLGLYVPLPSIHLKCPSVSHQQKYTLTRSPHIIYPYPHKRVVSVLNKVHCSPLEQTHVSFLNHFLHQTQNLWSLP